MSHVLILCTFPECCFSGLPRDCSRSPSIAGGCHTWEGHIGRSGVYSWGLPTHPPIPLPAYLCLPTCTYLVVPAYLYLPICTYLLLVPTYYLYLPTCTLPTCTYLLVPNLLVPNLLVPNPLVPNPRVPHPTYLILCTDLPSLPSYLPVSSCTLCI